MDCLCLPRPTRLFWLLWILGWLIVARLAMLSYALGREYGIPEWVVI